MMKKLYGEVNALARKEFERAALDYGAMNNSSHESYAVLKEEADEAHDETINVSILVDRYWESVKTNDTEKQAEYLKEVYMHSLLAACEYIQTAAMAHKAILTIDNTRSKNVLGEN